jgi:type 1 glutamine amidotransferase
MKTGIFSTIIGCCLLIVPPALAADDDTRGWIPLFNGKDLSNFYTFRQADGKNNDTQKVFKVEDGAIHVLDIADVTRSQPNGYVATNNEYRNYRLRLQYKWGEKKFPVPRHPEFMPRDAGLLFHIYGADRVWPQCLEFQIQEHDTGDVWLLNTEPRPYVTAAVAPATQPNQRLFTYQQGGAPTTIPAAPNSQRLFKSGEFERLTDWNTIELYLQDNSAVYVVNGHVANRIGNIRIGANGAPIVQGRIALQAESNEVFYRNIEIKPIFAPAASPGFKVLVFSKTTAFRHDSIPAGIDAIKRLGAINGYAVDATEDAGAFTDDNLKQYQAVIFLSTSGDPLNDAQQQAFERYIHNGGGYAGIHGASAGEYDWAWYGKLVGAFFDDHPSGTPTGTLKVEDPNHPLSATLPLTWSRSEEWYNFRTNPRPNVHVLATVDESTYTGGKMGADHPISWYHDFEGGRSFYTALGHSIESYSDPLFLMHLQAGIDYAAGRSALPPAGATVLFDGKDASQWCDEKGEPTKWPVHDGVLESKTRVGNIFTKEKFDSFQLHVEFKCPAVASPNTRNAITNEQSMGNSGVYMQGHYEAQILDSFDHPLSDMNDIGAIYSIKDADVNAAMPAEVWQRYDITYTAPVWQDGKKVKNARATVYLNGRLVQNDVEIPKMTQSGQPEAPGPGPIMLQDHLNPVQFRNIWIVPAK